MDEMNPFANLSKRIKVVTIAGKQIKIKPKVKDYSSFMVFGKDIAESDPNKKLELEELRAQKLMDTLVDIIARAYPSSQREDIEAFVADNLLETTQEIFIAMGLAKRDDFKKFEQNPLAKNP